MYHKSCTGIVHQTYNSSILTSHHGHHIYLTECRNMSTDTDLWTLVDYSDLLKAEHIPCKLCLQKLENRIAFSIREYCWLFGHSIDFSFFISEDVLPNVILHIQGK